MIVSGEIVAVGKVNIDKSGRNPKYQITISVKPFLIDPVVQELSGKKVLIFKSEESNITGQLNRLPETGEKIFIESKFPSDMHGSFPILAIRFQ